jgi:hypothetical protein
VAEAERIGVVVIALKEAGRVFLMFHFINLFSGFVISFQLK